MDLKKVVLDFANFPCPHCGFSDTHKIVGPGQESKAFKYLRRVSGKDDVFDEYEQRHILLSCARCDRETYRLIENGPVRIFTGQTSRPSGGPPPDRSQSKLRIVHQYPVGVPARGAGVPADVLAAMEEAEKCLAVGAPHACGTMVRRAVDALGRDKKATGADLYARLDDLRKRGVITQDLYEWAEELRVAGRHGAHPEWEDLTLEKADYAVLLLREIVKFVYILPAERASRRLKENAKKK
jgi:hypothetical protein